MTNQIRYYGLNAMGDEPGVVIGEVQELSVCIHVEWPWLLYLAALILATVVALALALAQRLLSSARPPVWKSSLLPVLFLGQDLARNERMLEGATLHKDELAAAAKRISARVSHAGDGTTLITNTVTLEGEGEETGTKPRSDGEP